MELKTFLLDQWLEEHERGARYNLAASTGPSWTLRELLSWADDAQKERLFETPLTYAPGTGHESLREHVASMYDARPEHVQIVTGASEALVALFFLATEPDANVVLPTPGYPPFLNIPESLGLEVRAYPLRHENGFELDVQDVWSLVDQNTKFVIVNTPHNPTGAIASEEALRELGSLSAKHGVQLVVDEVYHPIYVGEAQRSAAQILDGCTILGDFSKAFSLPGLRVGWILDSDRRRLQAFWNVRAHFSISNNVPGEILAEVAVQHRDKIFARAHQVARTNLGILEDAIGNEDWIDWVHPKGGMTAFPRLVDVESARPFCEAAATKGIVLAPGDCFGYPSHFRLGFGACAEGFDEAVRILTQDAVRSVKAPS